MRMAIEDADRFGFAGHVLRLGAQLPIHIRAQAVKTIAAVLLRDEGANLEGLAVFQEHDGAGNGSAGVAQDSSFDGTDARRSGLTGGRAFALSRRAQHGRAEKSHE